MMLPVSMQRGVQNIRGLLQAVSAEQTSPISRARDSPGVYSARRSSIPPSCTGQELPQEGLCRSQLLLEMQVTTVWGAWGWVLGFVLFSSEGRERKTASEMGCNLLLFYLAALGTIQ